ncbi:MAG: chorismate-binding protein [Thermoanaerobaculia bacterium]|nr:chorismate-binding protein [Thermoanaerobaculia bacterium]
MTTTLTRPTAAARARVATPHVREFLADTLTPLGVYRRLQAVSQRSFLLESISGGEQVSRFSFIGADPSVVCRLWPDRLEIERGGERGGESASGASAEATIERLESAPLAALDELLGSVRSPAGELPFTGGWVGFFGYDTIRMVERLPDRPPDPFGLPYAALARFDNVVVFDHARQRVVAVANEIEGEVDPREAEAALQTLTAILTRSVGGVAVEIPGGAIEPAPTHPPTLSSEAYQAAVRTAKDYIRAGDIFQVVPARRWRTLDCPDPLEIYRALRMVNPSPYMVLLESPEVDLVSASPEMVVRKTGNLLESRPIAGTRPRGKTPEEDHRLAAELLADPKERAEHVMLVDLHRNDLGKVAESASVHVPEFMVVEYYSHVIHLVSSVQARIRPDCTALEALLASFPAGTLSGAPKIRAMEIIEDLEKSRRGPYAGTVGYLSPNGDMDTCITIRTIVVRDGEASVTAGAGIVADSDPAAEVAETENKAAALLQAVALAQSLRTAP